MSLGYLLLSNNVFQLINFVQIVYFLAIGVAMLALIYLRHLMPDANRPIKVRDVGRKTINERSEFYR